MATKPIPIDGLDDPRVEAFRDVRDKDLRGHGRLFMAESEMVLRRLLRTPDQLHAIFLSTGKHAELASALDALPERVPVYVASIDVMTAIAGFHIHRGVLAAGVRPVAEALALDRALEPLRGASPLTLLVAEGITNVDNMGALFRNAAGLGADGILLDPTCCDPLYRKAIRVSMGHVLSTPWAVGGAWPDDLQRLKDEWNVTLVAAETAPDAVPLWALPSTEGMAFVFGSEAHGLAPSTLAACDVVCSIPMTGSVPSLNVAVASAVCLYERMRTADQRRG